MTGTSTKPCEATSAPRPALLRRMAVSTHWFPRWLRRIRRTMLGVSIPAPWLVAAPLLWLFVALRGLGFFLKRVFICEPLFKAYCRSYGRRIRTGVYIHWIQGRGDLIVGDHVWIDGKSTFTFAHRYADRPTLRIGDNSGVGHHCTFVVAKAITIGRNCLISGDDMFFDSSGHSSSAVARREGEPPPPEEVREIVIGNDVWIGVRCIIFPGVRIGDGAIVSAGSVVRSHVPPHSVVAGNPARVVMRLRESEAGGRSDRPGHAPWMGA